MGEGFGSKKLSLGAFTKADITILDPGGFPRLIYFYSCAKNSAEICCLKFGESLLDEFQ